MVDEDLDVLWAREPARRRANASTTKMVTALVVVERAGPAESVTVTPEAAATGGGGLDLQAGEVFSVRDLLVALLLSSSNDAAVALAEYVAGSEDAFVDLMNAFVRDAGGRDTRFVTAHGLDRPGHFSTARDLAVFGRMVLDDPLLRTIVATPRTTITGSRGAVEVNNRNSLLETYEGAVGIKTGFTAAAGDVLVAAARRGGRRLIAVALGSANAASDARRLLDLGFSLLRRTVLLRRGAPVGGLVFDPAGTATVRSARTVRGMTDPTTLRRRFTPLRELRLPLRPGAQVGAVVLAAGDRTVARVPAVVVRPPAPGDAVPLVEWLGSALRVGHALLGLPE